MKTLVVGGTGTVGGAVTRGLLAKGQEVRIMTRDAAKAQQQQPAGVDARVGDLNNPRELGPVFDAYGQFVNDVINFLIVAAAVFVLIKQVNRIKSGVDRPAPATAPATKNCPFCASTISIKATRCPQCTSQLGPA